MRQILEKYRLKTHELLYIISRNVFLFTNGIIFVVVILLSIFGDTRSALFLGCITLLNIFFGLIQDINAWVQLERLQLLTAPHVIRINKDQTEESILADHIKKSDLIKLKIGDQVPCDSVLIKAHSFEINEGLITGESDSISKTVSDYLLAGSVVTAGSGVIRIESAFHESRITRMTEGIKKYSIRLSPIQSSINLFIKYCGYILAVVLGFVIIRGFLIHEPAIRIIKNIGALTSALMPVGLFFATTLFFAYGAARLFRRHVLLQEVNATEKLGRIKNLCMDKTGTLTENTLVVEDIYVPPEVSIESAQDLTMAYIQGTGDSSQTLNAVKKFIGIKYRGDVVDSLSFSSWRRYGAVSIKKESEDLIVFGGAPDVFLPHISNIVEKKWLQDFLDKEAHDGKHVWCVMKVKGVNIPHDLSKVEFSIVAVYVFYNNLRGGIKHTINFFQERGVHIRIISGDNPETVCAVAALAGVKNPDNIITGKEMEEWSRSEFEEKVGSYTIFARIIPEQKEKIVEAFKKDGFTAMVGDGANDALAIKKADLGIAMFDGAPATRQLAAIVLTNNSFTAMPGGVTLADSIIRNVEIFSSIFLNLTFVGFFLFIFVSLFGYAFPLTPLNITLINYFTVGIPGILISYWTIMPSGRIDSQSTVPFLKNILPFAVSSSIIQTIFIAIIFIISPIYMKLAESNLLVIIAYIISGFTFFAFTPYVYRGIISKMQKLQILSLALIEVVLFLFVLKMPIIATFFDTTNLIPSFSVSNISIISVALCFLVYSQYRLAKYFVLKKEYGNK
ncbi:MAG: HAD-IC family P-type ATPase [Candidatus Paceibacterota bacterium]|jgi:cation-transporting ATPase E